MIILFFIVRALWYIIAKNATKRGTFPLLVCDSYHCSIIARCAISQNEECDNTRVFSAKKYVA